MMPFLPGDTLTSAGASSVDRARVPGWDWSAWDAAATLWLSQL